MQRHLILFISFLLCCESVLHAQQTQNFSQKAVVAYQPGTNTAFNEIIKTLSQGNGKTLRNTIFTVSAEQVFSAQPQANIIRFTIKNNALALNGDILYRGFDFSEVLYPSSISYTLKITATGFSKEFNLKSDVSNGRPADNNESLRDSAKRNFTYSLSNYKVLYNQSAANAVKDKAKLVDLYFEKATLLDQHFAILQAIDPYDLSAFRTIMPRIDQAQVVYDDILKADILNSLHSENDPARMNEKLNAYNALLVNKRNTASQVFSTLHLVFYDRGNDAMRDGNNTAAYDLYHASLEVNPAFAPSMLQLARIDFIRNDLNEAQCKADEILFRMLPDPATRSNTVDLMSNIKDAYVDKGLTSVGYKRYNEGLDFFNIAKDLCRRYPEIRCDDEINNGILKAHKGIYNEKLQEAKLAAAKNDFAGAEKKVNEAIAHYQKHLDGEPTDAFALQTALRQKQYDNLCASGRQLHDRADYENAVKAFTEADNLQRQYGLQKAADFDKNAKLSAGKYSAVVLLNGENAVKANNVTQARTDLQTVTDMQSRFGLSNDAGINKRAEALRSKIYTQQCANAQQSVDSAVTAARNFLHEDLYLPAMLVLETAMQVKKENADCRLSTDSMEAILGRVKPAGTYLQLLENARESIRKADYSNALKLYNESEKHYAEKSVAAYGLRHIGDRDEFVLEADDNGMIKYCAGVDLDNGKLDNSLRLYKLLLDRGVSANLLADELYQLGYKTGKQDYSRAPGGKAKKLAARYTHDDKRLKRFAKGYSKGYRK